MLLGRFTTRRPRIGGKTASFLVAVFALAAVLVPSFVFAQTSPDLGLNFATGIGLSTTDIRVTIGRIIGAFFAFLGIIAVVLILYAGFIWMTAGGNEEKISQAKKILINATIGLIIMMSAYAITAFLIRAITGQAGLPGLGGGGGPSAPSLFISGGSDALGSGILEYHYPEPGQTGVPRNTKIAITFKKPLVLSTIIAGYDDAGTLDIGDDTIPPQLLLNTENVKIIANDDLQAAGNGSNDEKFDTRYAQAVVSPVPAAKVTVVTDPAVSMQTLVITFGQPIGSPTADVNYRVALRGGAIRTGDPDLGVQVWASNPSGDAFVKQPAFSRMDSDGGYFWSFTTNTTIDTTPPKITSVVPRPIVDPSDCDDSAQSCVFRNQVMQVWFSEAVDPTTASGVIGTGGGFNNIDIKAKCREGKPCETLYDTEDFTVSVDGVMAIGNRYRTAEFLPSALCEGVVQNSCGEPVFCLPKNVELKMIMKAATVGDNPPQASEDNGIVDMVGNSLDGNGNATAQGPAGSISEEYSFNLRPSDVSSIKDTAAAVYFVGEDVDLVPPRVTMVDPPSRAEEDQDNEYNAEDPQAGGPSKVPVDLPISVTFSKNMMVTSMRTGRSSDPLATVVLDASECEKTSCGPTSCQPCKPIDAPSFTLESTLQPPGEERYTLMQMKHRRFFTANDLGYTMDETAFYPAGIPKYVPSLRAKLKDDRQNCFYPSRFDPPGGACTGLEVESVCVGGDNAGSPCPSTSCTGGGVCTPKRSCCNLTAMGTYSCPP